MLRNLPTKIVFKSINTFFSNLALLITVILAPSAYSDNGKALYQQCVACHGLNGEGNSAVGSPAIAGQYNWYTERQLMLFKNKLRGAHESDSYGNQMVATVQTLDFDKDVPDLATYIASLTPVSMPKPSEDSDKLKNGYRYYQAKCGACHGGSGEGNAAFKAPRLTNQSTDYLQRQMSNFINGVRGTEQEDKLGRQMAMMSKTVSEAELADILYFISTQ